MNTEVLMSKIDQTLKKGVANKEGKKIPDEEEKIQPKKTMKERVQYEQALVVSECVEQVRQQPDPAKYEADIQKYLEAQAQAQLELKLQDILLERMNEINLE